MSTNSRSLKGSLAAVVSLVVLASTTLIYQNCAPMGQASATSSGPSPNTSPFSTNKMLVSQSAKLASTNLPVGYAMTAIVSESCLKARHTTDITSAASGYFIEKYLPANFYSSSAAAATFDHYAVDFTLKKSVSLSDISVAVAKDACLIGLADHQTLTLKSSDAAPTFANQNYVMADQFTTADAGFMADIPSSVKVTVAVVDSGLDLNNTDLANLATDYNLGTDFSSGDPTSTGNDVQDKIGHGTAVAGLIGSQGLKNTSVVGLASRNVKILPIRVIQSDSSTASAGSLFMAIRRAVNGGAEVINISLAGIEKNGCDPVVGQALYDAVERGAFISMAAGNGLKPNAHGGFDPGAVIAPTEIGVLSKDDTIAPACWGQYLKGAISVAALNTGAHTLASFSNWGSQSIELSAPGTGLTMLGLNGASVSGSGTSFSTPQISAAAALAIAYHKARGWAYSPWLIEDILENGSVMDTSLATSVGVRKGRVLNFQALYDHLHGLINSTDLQRRQEPTDNADEGAGFNIASIGSQTIKSFEVYSTSDIVANTTSRVQFYAVAYYANGSYQDVTRQTTFTSSATSLLSVDAQGIGYPMTGAKGSVTVSGTYQGLTQTTSITLVDFDLLSGTTSSLQSLSLVPVTPITGPVSYSVGFRLIATYDNGLQRNVSARGSYASDDGTLSFISYPLYENAYVTASYGGHTATVYGFYHGMKAETNFTTPLIPYAGFCMSATPMVYSLGTKPSSTCDALHVSINGGAYYLNSSVLPTGTFYVLQRSSYSSTDCPGLASEQNVGFSFNPLNTGTKTCHMTVTGTYRGGGADQTVSKDFTLTIDADPIASLALGATKTLQFGSNAGFLNITATTNSGRIAPANPSDISVVIKNAAGQVANLDWSVNYYASMYNVLVYEGAAGDNITITASLKSQPSVSTSVVFPLHRDPLCQVPDLTGVVRPTQAPAANADVSYCTAARVALSPFAGGDGSTSNPFRICTSAQLLNVSKQKAIAAFKLESNIDLTSAGNLVQQPLIGVNDPAGNEIFDGGGHSISNLNMIDAEQGVVGLFSGSWSVVKNLIVDHATIVGANNVGVISGGVLTVEQTSQVRSIDSVYVVSSNITGNGTVGGFVGMGWGPIRNSGIFASKIQASSNAVGGFVGLAAADRYTYSGLTAQVDISRKGVPGGFTTVGGLIGLGNGLIAQASVSGTLTGVADQAGGLIGSADHACAYQASSSMAITAQGNSVGGLFGAMNSGSVSQSSFNGQLSGNQDVGGLYGRLTGTLSSNAGNQVQGSITCASNCGGVAGSIFDNADISATTLNVTLNGTPAGFIVGVFNQLTSPSGAHPALLVTTTTNNSSQALNAIGLTK